MSRPNGLVWLVIFYGVVAAEVTENFRNSQDQLKCDNEALKLHCEARCGENHGCLYGKCFCLHFKDDSDHKYIQKTAPKEDKFLDFDDYTEMTPLMPAQTFPERSALRHHIAHFCPNLEEARKCIRTCMQQGKPAFCGKDHVCYCGHKYEDPESNDKIDVKDIYAQFHDLYKKYFGDNDYHYDGHNDEYDNDHDNDHDNYQDNDHDNDNRH